MNYQTLFSPVTINGLELENRVIMAIARENLVMEDSFVTAETVDFCLKRTPGGVGMIVFGAVGVNHEAQPLHIPQK